MDKTIYDEKNGLYYNLGDDGMYYPAITIGEDDDYNIGKYGLRRETFLKEHRLGTYNRLLMTGKLQEHLREIDIQALTMIEEIMEHLAKANDCSEELKCRNQMEWVGKMNNYKKSVEEIIFNKFIYV